MARRTIGQARAVLDEMVLNPRERAELEREIKRHNMRFRQQLEEDQQQNWDQSEAAISETKKGLRRVAKGFAALEMRGSTGDITAADYLAEFRELEMQRDKLRTDAMAVERSIEEYEAFEDDPEASVESFLERYPTLQPEFTF